MKNLIIVALVVAVVGFFGFIVVKNARLAKATKEDRGNFNGMTRTEFTDNLNEAWRLREIEATTGYILNDPEGAEWRQAIELQIVDSGGAKTLEEAAREAAVFVSPNRHKAWAVDWSRGWLVETYAKGILGVDARKKEVHDILKTI